MKILGNLKATPTHGKNEKPPKRSRSAMIVYSGFNVMIAERSRLNLDLLTMKKFEEFSQKTTGEIKRRYTLREIFCAKFFLPQATSLAREASQ